MSNTVIEVLVPGPQGAVGDAVSLRGSAVPEDYDGSKVYLAGAKSVYQNVEYKAVTDTVIGPFVIASWKAVTVEAMEDRLTSLEAAVALLQG